MIGAVFAVWAFAARASLSCNPPSGASALLGLVTAVAALVRPGNQVLIAFAVVPLVVGDPWRTRVAAAAVRPVAAVLVLGGWALKTAFATTTTRSREAERRISRSSERS